VATPCSEGEWLNQLRNVPGTPVVSPELLHAGPAVARLLHAVERQWVAQGFPDKARAEAIADAVVAAA
jgi:hypothetical protein